ncbi:MAG: hypothetical protein HOP13_16280 [Alphaproteobacteria bacterium]|nr:hypothetical protein [Alphaproteobacteria bacterium]
MKEVLNRLVQNLSEMGRRIHYVAPPLLMIMGVSRSGEDWLDWLLFWAALSILLMVVAGFFLARHRR